MSSLLPRVRLAIEEGAVIPAGGRVLVALSGGGDSVALAALMCDASSDAPWSVAGFLHVNHHLRPGAAGDERFCRALADRFGVPWLVEHADVARLARDRRVSIEEAGHQVRYAAFERAVGRGVADRVATAHTRDDLAETVLLRLVRGAGPRGLAGICPRHGVVIRPVLDITRQELRDFLGNRGLAHRDDETNDDLRVTRNRIRHTLLPFLAEHFSPRIVNVLAREAAIARADADWMDQAVNDAAARLVEYRDGGATVAATLAGEPVALARRVAKQVLERIGGKAVGFDHVERFLRLLADRPRPREAGFPGSRVSRHGGGVRVDAAAGRRPAGARVPRFEYLLPVPGAVAATEVGETVSVARADRPPPLAARGRTVAVSGDRLSSPLVVRNWRPGDRVRPLGLGGRKKLQDFFVDRKIPREQREKIPIVADSRGRIVWVAGHTVGDDFRVTGADRGVLILKVMKSGGTA